MVLLSSALIALFLSLKVNCVTISIFILFIMGQQMNLGGRHYDREPPQKGRRRFGPGMKDLTGTI